MPSRRRPMITAAIVAVLALGSVACGSDAEPGPGASPAPPSTTSSGSPETTATTEPAGGERCTAQVNSPATFAADDGQYAAYLTDVDVAGRGVSFNVVQFLSGGEAEAAFREAYPDEPDGPPNDYFIVDENPQVRSAQVTSDVDVRLVRLSEDSDADLDPGTFEELPEYFGDEPRPETNVLSTNPFWLTFAAGAVTAMCEQYIP